MDVVTDQQALQMIWDLFATWKSTGFTTTFGIALLSMLMTFMKWEKFGNLFDKVEEKFGKSVKSFVPIVLGAGIGLLTAMGTDGVTPILMLKGLIEGALIIGGFQQVLYQQLKGTKLGDWLAKIVKTTK